MEASFTIKIGNAETTCSGSESFLKEQIPVILDYLKRLEKTVTIGTSPQTSISPAQAKNGATNLAINSIAAKMGVKSGTDLILAAVYSLAQAGKATASRPEIINEMKKATSYFKKSVVNNLSNYLSTLIKDGKLLEQSSENYALSVNATTEIESKLA